MPQYVCNPDKGSISWILPHADPTLPSTELTRTNQMLILPNIRHSLAGLASFTYHDPYAAVKSGFTLPSGQTEDEVYHLIAGRVKDLPTSVRAPDPSTEPTPEFDAADPLPWLQHFIKHASPNYNHVLIKAVTMSGLSDSAGCNKNETTRWLERFELLVGLYARNRCNRFANELESIDLEHFASVVTKFDELLSGWWNTGQLVPLDMRSEHHAMLHALLQHLQKLWVRSINPSSLADRMKKANVNPLSLINALTAAVGLNGRPMDRAEFDLLFDLFVLAAVFDITTDPGAADDALWLYKLSRKIGVDTKRAAWNRIGHLGVNLEDRMKARWNQLKF